MNEQHIIAEQHVIGGLLLNPMAVDKVGDILTARDFSSRNHGRIYSAVADLAANGEGIDVFTVSDLLEKRGELNAVGGLAKLGEMVKSVPGTANIEHYARVVRNASLERQLLAATSEIAELVRNPGDTRAKLDKAQAMIGAIAEEGSRIGPVLAKNLLPGLVNYLQDMLEREGEVIGQPTGFTDFDSMTSGLQETDLIIVAGRPSMGKTTFAMNIAEHVAVQAKKPVAVFSLEMSAQQLLMRASASMGRIPFQRVRAAKMDESEWARFTGATGRLMDSRLFIDETPGLTIMELRTRARRLHREHGLGLVVLDYLQLMGGDGENRVNVVSEISRGLKLLAKELRVPVIALSQLNRSVEARQIKRPIMSDLRESGAIEQDADLIAFLYRDEVYNEHSNAKGTAEVIIGKQRNGPLGMVRLTANLDICRFDNYAGPPIEEGDGENVVRPKKWSKGFEYN